jgi:hypothetical protein
LNTRRPAYLGWLTTLPRSTPTSMAARHLVAVDHAHGDGDPDLLVELVAEPPA